MKILLTIILSHLMTACFSQTYETKKIIAKADSMLKVATGGKLYRFFKYDPKTYYTYNVKHKLKSEILDEKLMTKGDFKKATVNFNFHNANYPWIYGYASIKFDSLLNEVDSINLNFIPDFLRKGDECNFISKEQAIQIATDSVLKGRIK